MSEEQHRPTESYIEVLKGFLYKDFTIDSKSIINTSSLEHNKPTRKIKQLNKFLTSEVDFEKQEDSNIEGSSDKLDSVETKKKKNGTLETIAVANNEHKIDTKKYIKSLSSSI